MTTPLLHQYESTHSCRPVQNSAGKRQGLVEEACLTGLSVVGGLLFLVLLLLVVELLYFALTMQNRMFFLPSPSVS